MSRSALGSKPWGRWNKACFSRIEDDRCSAHSFKLHQSCRCCRLNIVSARGMPRLVVNLSRMCRRHVICASLPPWKLLLVPLRRAISTMECGKGQPDGIVVLEGRLIRPVAARGARHLATRGSHPCCPAGSPLSGSAHCHAGGNANAFQNDEQRSGLCLSISKFGNRGATGLSMRGFSRNTQENAEFSRAWLLQNPASDGSC